MQNVIKKSTEELEWLKATFRKMKRLIKFETDHEEETKTSGMLCYIKSNIQLRMLDNI